ncbi:MAG: tyrosine-type recombinase/integrase [Ginsengibacter sp.]
MHQPEPYPIQNFLNYLTFQKRYSHHTIISYRTDLTSFFDFLFIEYQTNRLDEISAPIARSWLASLKSKKESSRTINRKISSLRSFFKYQLKKEEVAVNPFAAISSLKISKRLPVFIEEKDIRKLFEEGKFPETWEGKLHFLIFALLYQTGIRLSELIGLQENHIDKSSSVIKVLGKGNKERLLPVGNELLSYIDNYISEKRKLFSEASNVFLLVNEKGKPLYPKYVYNAVRKGLSDVSTIERKSPHVMRHSFATHLTNHGAQINAIKDLLGHTSLAATQIYTHNSIEKLKEVHKQAHPKS